MKFTLYNLKKFFINFRLFDVEVFHLDFKLAFDKNLGLELFVFKRIYYDKSKKIFFSSVNGNGLGELKSLISKSCEN